MYFGVTFHALSNGIFSLQSQNFSATSLGGDLMDPLLIADKFSIIHLFFTIEKRKEIDLSTGVVRGGLGRAQSYYQALEPYHRS